jgi:hypothetical protein
MDLTSFSTWNVRVALLAAGVFFGIPLGCLFNIPKESVSEDVAEDYESAEEWMKTHPDPAEAKLDAIISLLTEIRDLLKPAKSPESAPGGILGFRNSPGSAEFIPYSHIVEIETPKIDLKPAKTPRKTTPKGKKK